MALDEALCITPRAAEASAEMQGFGKRIAVPMSGQQRTIRLSVGLFNGPETLSAAVLDLCDRGLESECFCCLGMRGALDDDASSNAYRSAIPVLFENLCEIEGLIGDGLCLANAGPLLDDLTCTPPVQGRARMFRLDWLSSLQSARLADHLRGGGLILIVSSRSPAQQDASCRSLLRHSRHGVQTHDFTLNAASAGHAKTPGQQ